jgi:hypothetical protein
MNIKQWMLRIAAVMVVAVLGGCASYDTSHGGHAVDIPDPGAWYGQ